MLLGPEPDAHQAWVSLLREAYRSKHAAAAIAPPPAGGPGGGPSTRRRPEDDGAGRPPKQQRSTLAKLAAATGLAFVMFVLLLWRSRSGGGSAAQQPAQPGFCDRPGNQCDEPGEFAAMACRPGAAARCADWVREEARVAEDATWSAWQTHACASFWERQPWGQRMSSGHMWPRSWHPCCMFMA